MAKLTIDCSTFFSFLAFTKPNIKINGMPQNGTSWGFNTYEVQAGTVQINVSKPWFLLLPIPMCVAQTSFSFDEQDVLVLKYKVPFFIFLPGTLSVVSQTKSNPVASSPMATAVVMPDICPHCKNPNTRKTRLCEWCGSQIV